MRVSFFFFCRARRSAPGRDIELGRSMRVWLGSMGLSIGGTTYKLVNEQARRISSCSLTFFADRSGAQIKSRGGFVKTEITMSSVVSDQPALWQDRVLLDEDFFRALREHPVPVSEAALRLVLTDYAGSAPNSRQIVKSRPVRLSGTEK